MSTESMSAETGALVPTSGNATYATQLSAPKTMLLFVHGFLGSEHSFENFPLDLAACLRGPTMRVPDVEVRIFPRFDTKGDPTRAVNQLCNWLLLNATEPEYSGVIILAHSMGGLMAVDAYRKMYGLWDEEVEEKLEKERKAAEKERKTKEKAEKAKEKEQKKANEKEAKQKADNKPSADTTAEKKEKEKEKENGMENGTDKTDSKDSLDKQVPKPDPAVTAAAGSWFGAVGSWWAKKDAANAARITEAKPGTAGEAAAHPPAEPATMMEPPAASPLDLKAAVDEMEPAPSDQRLPSEPPTKQKLESESIVSDALAVAPVLPAPNATSQRKRPPVRIIGIVTFDTPFFGLHTRVYTAAAGTRAASLIAQYVPPLPPMPAVPTPHMPFGDALSTIPHVVGAGVHVGTRAATDALRYGTRAVGSIPEAATGIVTALPGTVAALPGAATQGLQMGLQAVSALPGATLHYGSSALSSVAQLPTYWSAKPAAPAATDAPGPAVAEDQAPAPVPASETQMTTIEAVEGHSQADGSDVVVSAASVVEEDRNESTTSALMINDRLQDGMQDETVVFAAAVAAAAAAVEHSRTLSEAPTPTTELPPEEDADALLPPAPITETSDDESADPHTAAASAVGLHPIPPESNWTPWVRLGLAGAAVAAGAYYSGGLVFAAPVVRRVAVAYALSHAEDARKHLQFLYPLWGTGTKTLDKRVQDMSKDVEDGHLGFTCFYAELPPVVAASTASTADEASTAFNANANGVEDDSSITKTAAAKSSADRLKTRLATIVRTSPATTTVTTTTTTITTVVTSALTDSATAVADGEAKDTMTTTTTTVAVSETKTPSTTAVFNSPVAAAFATQLAASRPSRSSSPSPTPPPLPSRPSQQQTRPPQPPQPRTFIAMPPQHHAHLFRPIHSDAEDEIHAHMNMFERSVNAASYWALVDRVARQVAKCIARPAPAHK
ncbi:hypothetical protein PhCBS80983_g03414 [Powellomyces hirtus]|uniref:DUF676 domain-containing protein n=1 Tax=Powellomyces hirtus TaxID=109895 RepID=A0A507E3Y6_9FUNG|nr:hypothetical protein PhCBS80983_g03414 [Powellomyces hirtus]